MQQAAVGALQQELCSVASGAARHRRIDRSENPQAVAGESADEAGGDIEESVRIAAACRGGTQQRESGEGWPVGGAALFECIVRDAGVAALDQAAPERMRRKRRLDDDFADPAFTTRTAGHLDDRLRQPLVTAKVGAEQPLVGVDDADQRELGEMVALGQHLRADQDVGLAAGGALQRFVHGALALRAVAVDAHHLPARVAAHELVFQSLGALAERPHGRAALAAVFVERPRTAAMVATQPPLLRVHRHARIAA